MQNQDKVCTLSAAKIPEAHRACTRGSCSTTYWRREGRWKLRRKKDSCRAEKSSSLIWSISPSVKVEVIFIRWFKGCRACDFLPTFLFFLHDLLQQYHYTDAQKSVKKTGPFLFCSAKIGLSLHLEGYEVKGWSLWWSRKDQRLDDL